ncbi:MAG: GNAT family N-acetyltransferase [Pseudomonadota bacterium]
MGRGDTPKPAPEYEGAFTSGNGQALGPLNTRMITDRGTFAAMESAWNNLLAASESDSPFLTHQWLSAWLDIYGGAVPLRVLVAEDLAGLAGAVPFYLDRRRSLGVPVEVLRFLGDRDCGADFLNIILRPDREAETAAALAGRLVQEPSWRVLSLDHVDSRSRSFRLFLDELGQYLDHLEATPRETCPYLRLPETFESFMDIPDRTFKRIIAKDEVRYAKKHTLRLLENIQSEEIEPLLERLFETHVERFGLRGGTLGDPRRQEFYRRIARAFHEKGWLNLAALEIDGSIEAVDFDLVYGRALYILQGGITSRGLAVKAGNIMALRTLRGLSGAIGELHYLRGDELYKYQWGCESIMTLGLPAARGLSGRAYSLTQAARRLLKSVKQAVRPFGNREAPTVRRPPGGLARPNNNQPVPDSRVRALWVTDRRQWRDLAGEWDALAGAARPDNPFLSHDWLSCWWDIYGTGRDLALAVVRDGPDLVGIAPLWSGRRGVSGVSLDVLSYLGGDFGGAEYLDFIVLPGKEKVFFTALAGLLAERSGLDRLCLERHDASSRNQAYLKAALADRPMILKTRFGYVYPCLSLPINSGAGAARDKALHQGADFQVVLDIPADQRVQALTRLRQLHDAQALARGEQSAFADPRKADFYALLEKRPANTGRLRLSGVLLGGEYQVVELGLGAGRAHFALESGAAPEAERLGLDRLLTTRLMHSRSDRAAAWTSLKYHDPHIFCLDFSMRPTIHLDFFFGAKGRAAAVLKDLAGFARDAYRLLRPR